jgi:hypothetical protein
MSEGVNDMLAAEAARMEAETGTERTFVQIPPPKEPSQVYSVRIPVARLDELRKIAAGCEQAPSTLLREWVLERLDMERHRLVENSDDSDTTARLFAPIVIAMSPGRHVLGPLRKSVERSAGPLRPAV